MNIEIQRVHADHQENSTMLDNKIAVVVTTINHPTAAVIDIQNHCAQLEHSFYVIGDSKSPDDFSLPGSQYLSIDAQLATGFKFAEHCPTRHYARKNIGYLAAVRDGADVIVETDDDNIPLPAFWDNRVRRVNAEQVREAGWVNAYRYFSDALIWPRGLPLNVVQGCAMPQPVPAKLIDCPIQQGLADRNPDVDAIYRLLLPLPFSFAGRPLPLALGAGVWCPFNSQNTTFWRDVFPLLYLPYYCSFRMTDIWRSFVAQRLLWANGWSLLFHNSTVFQERNEHDLMIDFRDEVPGYLNNDRIRKTLEDLNIRSGKGALPDDLRACYRALVALDVVGSGEEPLLNYFLEDLLASGWE